MINLKPKSSLLDKITKINISRLKPLQNITLGAEIVGDKGEKFESHAHFIADRDGEVDVCRDPSLGGSYSGVSPMGLLWSMKPAPGQRKGTRLMKSDVTKPYNIILNCFDDHVTPNESSLKPLSSVTFQKWYMAEGVKRIPVREGRIRGTLFLPPGDGPFPGKTFLFNYFLPRCPSLWFRWFVVYLFVRHLCFYLFVRSSVRPFIHVAMHPFVLSVLQPPSRKENLPVVFLACINYPNTELNHFILVSQQMT